MSRQLLEDAKKVLLSEATKLDPVGREDKDIDNDGDSDKTDSYLKKRRGAISAAIAQSKNEGVELSEEDAQRLSDILRGMGEQAEQIDESDDLGPEKKKQKTVMLVHKTSGREKVIVDTPENREKNAELGFHPMKEETELDEGSGPKEKQKTPYRDINSPESRAAAAAQRERMAAADEAEAGKKLLARINARKGVKAKKGVREEVVVEGGIETPRKTRAEFLPPAPGTYAADLAAGRYKANTKNLTGVIVHHADDTTGKIKQTKITSSAQLERHHRNLKEFGHTVLKVYPIYDGEESMSGRLIGARATDLSKWASLMKASENKRKTNEEVEQIDEITRAAKMGFSNAYPSQGPSRYYKPAKTVKGPKFPTDRGAGRHPGDALAARARGETFVRSDLAKEIEAEKPGSIRPARPQQNPRRRLPGESPSGLTHRRTGTSSPSFVKSTSKYGIAGPQGHLPEELDLQEYDLIEKFNVNIPEIPSYQDYVNAALKIAECKSFSELSEEYQEYIMNELEEAAATNDVSFILEAEAMSDMTDTVQRLQKAGHKIEDMGRDYKGNPFYMYVDKMSGMRRKVTYKGNQKMTQNMGLVKPDKEDVAEANETLGSQFDDFMASRNANRKPGQPMMKPRTAQSVIKPGGPKTPEDALAHLVKNIPSGIKQVGFPKK